MERKTISLSVSSLKTYLFLISDYIFAISTLILGYLATDGVLSSYEFFFVAIIGLVKVIIYMILGLYKTNLDHITILDEIKIAVLVAITDLLVYLSFYLPFVSDEVDLAFPVMILIYITEVFLIISLRLVKRLVRFHDGSTKNKNAPNTIIVGAGSAAKMLYSEISTNKDMNYHIVCYVDDDKTKIGKKYLGRVVEGPISNIKEIIEKYDAKEVILAIASLGIKRQKEIIESLVDVNVKVKKMPNMVDLDSGAQITIKPVSIAELLGREEIVFDEKEIRDFITGKRVLVTGAGGSIGSELVRQIYSYNPSELILFDIYENSTYDIEQETIRKIHKDGKNIKLTAIIGSTYNENRVEEVFAKYKPEIIFHAAAYKHVPLMENSPVEAIRTNCVGTYNVAFMANKYKALKMVLVSTDKAVRPTNVMGATKRFAEMIIQYFAEKSTSTSYSAVRFGNVLGSNGSVIPLFRKQIEEGGPITVTDKNIIRYFMSIPEAVSLILQSGAYATKGEIFILDMGKPVKILTLAENVIRQAGYVPYKDIDIVFTGLRPGEKLYEELLIDVSKCEKTKNSKIYIEEKQKTYPMDENVKYIKQVFDLTDNDKIKDCLRQVVTNYTDYIEFNKKNEEELKSKETR